MNAELSKLRDVIRREMKRKSYEKVELALQKIDCEFGPAEANRAIHDFKLNRRFEALE